MISRYKRSLIELFSRVRLVHDNPKEKMQECLAVQETLIRKLTYTERRIRKCKNEIRILKRTLGGKENDRLSKDGARLAKEKINQLQSNIDDYQYLQSIFRDIGDALAFSYINKWDIKPMAFKEPPGSLSGKRGNRLERKILRESFRLGHVVILNDITNCLRYGDLTVPKGGQFMVIEAKSGKRKTQRDQRQEIRANEIVKYIQTNSTQRLYQKDGEYRRVNISSPEINHQSMLNNITSKALKEGNGLAEVEAGLFYVASTKFDSSILTSISNNRKGELLTAIVNLLPADYPYYPIILSLKNSEEAYQYYTNDLTIW